MASLEYEWDEAKRESNIAKHGVDFVSISDFDWENASIIVDSRHGEPRLIAIGPIHKCLHVVVFTARSGRIRIISLRKANRREEKNYAQEQE